MIRLFHIDASEQKDVLSFVCHFSEALAALLNFLLLFFAPSRHPSVHYPPHALDLEALALKTIFTHINLLLITRRRFKGF